MLSKDKKTSLRLKETDKNLFSVSVFLNVLIKGFCPILVKGNIKKYQ